MYLSVSDRVISIMKTSEPNFVSKFQNLVDTVFGTNGNLMDAMLRSEDQQNQQEINAVFLLKQKLADLKEKLHEEAKAHTGTQKQQKKVYNQQKFNMLEIERTGTTD